MHFVDEINFETTTRRSVLDVIQQVAGIFNFGARGGVDFNQIDKAPCSISRQLSHTPHGVAVMPVSQFSPFASSRAIEVFPTPRVPEKDKHDEYALTTSRSPVRSAHVPGRRRQQRFVGAIFGLRPDNSLAGSETLEGGFSKGNANTAPSERRG